MILVGDGAFQMTGFELGNCRRNGWDPIVIVFNNSSWEMLRVFQPESRFNDLDDWHFSELARVLGGDGVRVETREQLAVALERAVATRGRFLIVLSGGNTPRALYRSLRDAKTDLRSVWDLAKPEIPGLYKALLDGRIDGSQYEGECACLVGTIANIRGVHFERLGDLRPSSSRPAERFFLAIKKGDTPSTNQFSQKAAQWVEQWLGNMRSAFATSG